MSTAKAPEAPSGRICEKIQLLNAKFIFVVIFQKDPGQVLGFCLQYTKIPKHWNTYKKKKKTTE